MLYSSWLSYHCFTLILVIIVIINIIMIILIVIMIIVMMISFGPTGSALHLGRLEEGDGGVYRCQVDYSQVIDMMMMMMMIMMMRIWWLWLWWQWWQSSIFKQAPTTVSTARLVLLVPPSPPIILHSGVLIKVSFIIVIIINISIIIVWIELNFSPNLNYLYLKS